MGIYAPDRRARKIVHYNSYDSIRVHLCHGEGKIYTLMEVLCLALTNDGRDNMVVHDDTGAEHTVNVSHFLFRVLTVQGAYYSSAYHHHRIERLTRIMHYRGLI